MIYAVASRSGKESRPALAAPAQSASWWLASYHGVQEGSVCVTHPALLVFIGKLADPAWIQAGGCLALALIALLTFVFFCIHVRATQRLAHATAQLLSQAQMPLLVLTQKHFEDELHQRSYTRWAIENLGSGPALDVSIVCKYEFMEGNELETYQATLNPIPAEAETLLSEPRPSKERILDCQIQYSSLAGKPYATKIAMLHGELVTRFEKAN
jgi:hypothetical protein